MKNRKAITVTLFILLFVGITSGAIALAMWNKPLGTRLGLPTFTPRVTQLAVLPAVSTGAIGPGVTPIPGMTVTQPADSNLTATPAASPTVTQQPMCKGPASMTILAIGSDQRRTGYLYGLADSIHIVYIDFMTPKMMVIDFPRDLWVEIPGISDHYGITHGKLNQAYLYGNPGMGYYDGPGEGPGLMARTLDYNFGLRVNHYVAIDTRTFVKLIDSVGGIDVQVESSIDMSYGYPTPSPDLFLSAGKHHLDGEHALILATNRIPTTFQRMEYQKIILSALRDKLLGPEMLPKLPKLVAQFITSVQTDFSPSEINSLLCITQAIPKGNILASSLPQEMFKAGGIYDPSRRVTTFVYQADFDQIRAMMVDFMNGVWPFPKN